MCKISVIVPVYNAEGTLETALSSVFMQRRPRAVPYAGKRRRRHGAQ